MLYIINKDNNLFLEIAC